MHWGDKLAHNPNVHPAHNPNAHPVHTPMLYGDDFDSLPGSTEESALALELALELALVKALVRFGRNRCMG